MNTLPNRVEDALKLRTFLELRARQAGGLREMIDQSWLRPGEHAPKSGVYHVARPDNGDWSQALRKTRQFLSLKANWDSYGAVPIPHLTWGRAYRMLTIWRDQSAALGGELPAPFVAPCGNGSIQFEWTVGRRSLEIEIHADIRELPSFVASIETADETKYYTGKLRVDDVASAKSLMRWLVTDK